MNRTKVLLGLSLSMNVMYYMAYSNRLKRYEKLIEQQVQLGYRVNNLLLENDIVPDKIVLNMLRDLGIGSEYNAA